MSYLLILIGIVVLVIALYGIFVSLKDLYYCLICHFWPSTTGIIETSEIRSYMVPSRAVTHAFRVVLSYSYVINGQKYTSDKIYLPEYKLGVNSEDKAKVELKEYGPQSPVMVFYDPNDPSKCCLKRNFSLTLFPIAFLLFLFSVSFIILSHRSEIIRELSSLRS